MRRVDIKNKKKVIICSIGAAFLSVLVLLICFAMLGVAPFGEHSVLTHDCYIQYIDYFQYLKDVYSGKAEIAYSFSKSLGGSLVALFGYYLSSPFNLLIIFFEKEQLEQFVFLITVLKIGMCGFTFSLFIQKRLPRLHISGVYIVSLAYAVTQYNIGQLSNINWLDGVYMLPIILLGIWLYITEGKKLLFYVSIALSIVFNWYTGYMNCIFAMLYFIYEKVQYDRERNQLSFKSLLVSCVRFTVVEVLGVLLSCFFFIPVVFGQSNGRSVFDEGIFKFATNGRFVDIFRGFMIGTPNMGLTKIDSTITLFCGTLTLMFCIYYFSEKNIKLFHKIMTSLLILVMVFSEYIQPLEHIWNGFKFANAFQYRFAYITIFCLIYTGAMGLQYFAEMNILKIGIISGGLVLMFILFHLYNNYAKSALLIEILLLVVYFVLLLAYRSKYINNTIVVFALVCVFVGELSVNGYFVASDNYVYPVSPEIEFATYSSTESSIIDAIKTNDTSFYRMEQNMTRDMIDTNVSFFANESMAYGFNGIMHYSSSYDLNVASFIMAAGYCKNIFPSFYNEPILTSDSLLGVKYLLSTKEYLGYVRRDDIEGGCGKEVYENPYALSLAFGADAGILDDFSVGNQTDIGTIEKDNPFEYQNKLYSKIMGEEIELYKKIDAQASGEKTKMVYSVFPENQDQIVYGYTRSNTISTQSMRQAINGIYVGKYENGWASSGVFEVGSGMEEYLVSYTGIDCNGDEFVDGSNIASVFYALDLEYFEAIIDTLKSHEMRIEEISGTNIFGNYIADGDGYLLTTIPYEDQWDVYVNGNKVDIEKGLGTFIAIPVKEGNNMLEFVYHVRGVKEGILLSVFSLVCMILWNRLEKQRKIVTRGIKLTK